MKCSKCGADVLGSEQTCPMCGGELVESEAMPKNEPTAKQPELNMGWYKAVRLLLIAGALMNVKNGIEYVSHTAYGLLTDWMYDSYPGLQTFDMIYGIAIFAFAALGVVTSIRLWKFRKNSPKLLISVYALGTAMAVLYQLVSIIMFKIEASVAVSSLTAMIPGVLINVIFIIINIKYFKKRAHLFTK